MVFKLQTACHIFAHEANAEQIFSRAGLLSDPNMDVGYLPCNYIGDGGREQEQVLAGTRCRQEQVGSYFELFRAARLSGLTMSEFCFANCTIGS